jgi:hypothetical protein
MSVEDILTHIGPGTSMGPALTQISEIESEQGKRTGASSTHTNNAEATLSATAANGAGSPSEIWKRIRVPVLFNVHVRAARPRTSFEAFQNSDPKTLNKLPGGCLVVHGDPTFFIADAVKESAAAVCIRLEHSPLPCLWFSLGKVIARLPAGQQRI